MSKVLTVDASGNTSGTGGVGQGRHGRVKTPDNKSHHPVFTDQIIGKLGITTLCANGIRLCVSVWGFHLQVDGYWVCAALTSVP